MYFLWLAASYLWNLSLPEFVKDKVRPPSPREESPREGNPREGNPREGNPREDRPREGNPREEEEAGIGPAIRRLMSYESVLNPDEGADTDSDDAENTASGSVPGQGTAPVATDTTDVIHPQQVRDGGGGVIPVTHLVEFSRLCDALFMCAISDGGTTTNSVASAKWPIQMAQTHDSGEQSFVSDTVVYGNNHFSCMLFV